MNKNKQWETHCPATNTTVWGEGDGVFECPGCGDDISVTQGQAVHAFKLAQGYEEEYNEKSFWTKVRKYAKKAGREVIEKALLLYYALVDSDTPAWAQGVIVGALGYFISPIDAIPDMIPVVGYMDDLAVMAAALVTVACHIKVEHSEKAEDKLKRWFG